MSLVNKEFSIKAGAVQRIRKELEYYRQELLQQQQKVDKMAQDDAGSCPHELAKQREVLQETANIIPNSEERLQAAVDDLKLFVVCFVGINTHFDRSDMHLALHSH